MSDTSATDSATDTTTDSTTTDEPDWKAEAEKWKTHARSWEGKAKNNSTAAKELEQLRQASMSDQEKAVAKAREEARTEALREFGAERVADAVRVATAGRSLDVDALLEGLDRTRFVTDDGQPDREAIEKWVERIAPADEGRQRGFPDLGQGARGTGKPSPEAAFNSAFRRAVGG